MIVPLYCIETWVSEMTAHKATLSGYTKGIEALIALRFANSAWVFSTLNIYLCVCESGNAGLL